MIQELFQSDLDILFSDWGVKASYQGTDIDVIFDRGYLDDNSASRMQTIVTLKESQGYFKQGDVLSSNGKDYVIEQIEPDTPGLVKATVTQK